MAYEITFEKKTNVEHQHKVSTSWQIPVALRDECTTAEYVIEKFRVEADRLSNENRGDGMHDVSITSEETLPPNKGHFHIVRATGHTYKVS